MAPNSPLKDKATTALKHNPSALGDPISIKSETTPSEHDLQGSGSPDTPTTPKDNEKKQQQQQQQRQAPKDSQRKGDGKSLKEVAEAANPSMLGDPVSLKAETSETQVTEGDRGALRDGEKKKGKGDSKL
ncbi:uncharacterized protein HMPREF1541_00188 [Cyphellophora europaea CBS 101466]|uniref:Uncharacterized protein n=1 Tax=Cyphellophora europaea (strain CBS 101466) TaxID=1220924 RepID=W2SBM1_CYPE1|nr:uncharacterized protein HMPREF1541_00188 [Cyphellophora europaea CBS 101466]ETN46005.1 hypothetical protein HMPREF1541_00188 [Cyphellophora europaea CBS 101466]